MTGSFTNYIVEVASVYIESERGRHYWHSLPYLLSKKAQFALLDPSNVDSLGKGFV